MSKTYNVLIIDDHPIIIEGFNNALNYIKGQSDGVSFNTDSAGDCKTAYNKLKSYIPNQNLDLVILDISLPPDENIKLQSGTDLGVLIREWLPNTKILVCTFFTEGFRLWQIKEAFHPLGFINKGDLNIMGFVDAINDVLANKTHYSSTIVHAINHKSKNKFLLDAYDRLILQELSNGAKMKDLLKIIHLSKSAIDKRKRALRRKFNIDSNSDRDLVLAAKAKGII